MWLYLTGVHVHPSNISCHATSSVINRPRYNKPVTQTFTPTGKSVTANAGNIFLSVFVFACTGTSDLPKF